MDKNEIQLCSEITNKLKSMELEAAEKKISVDRRYFIEEIYKMYLISKSKKHMEWLCSEVDKYFVPYAKRQMFGWDYNNIDDVLQEIRLGVYSALIAASDKNIGSEDIVRYLYGVYKKQASNQKRKISRITDNELTILDEPVNESGSCIGDFIESQDSIEAMSDNKIRSQTMSVLLSKYLETFVNYKTPFQRSLAMFYARIYPHILEEIPDNKAASAKWAFKKMEDKNVMQLADESNIEFQKNIFRLRWCDYLINQLSENVEINSETYILKDVIYTSVYGIGLIEDWSENLHKQVTKCTWMELLNDEELCELAEEYISRKRKIFKLINREGK